MEKRWFAYKGKEEKTQAFNDDQSLRNRENFDTKQAQAAPKDR